MPADKLNYFNIICEKWCQQVLLSTDIVTPNYSNSHWKWYKMVEVNGVYKHGRYKQLLKSLPIMSNIKVFGRQDGQLANQPDGQTTWLITNIHTVTYMDHKY